MGKNTQVSKPVPLVQPTMPDGVEQKTVEMDNDKAIGENNILANFINSENTDITVEKNEAELNDKIDDSEMDESKKLLRSAQDKLKDIPKKYWKHQTV